MYTVIKTLKRLIILVQLWHFNTIAMGLIQSRTAIRVEGFDDLYFTSNHITDLSDVVSPTRCAIFCGQNEACLTFFYNKLQKRCRLHDAEFFDKIEGEISLDWRFYASENKDCPLYNGFYQESNGLCLHVATDILNFINAQQYCSELHSRVVTLETTEKRLAVENFKKRRDIASHLPHGNVWLGLKKTLSGWQWESGSFLGQEVNWGYSQPHCPANMDCNCASSVGGWHGQWEDCACSESIAVISLHILVGGWIGF